MMKKMQKTLCVLVTMGATILPAMAASVDVIVTGTITPAACTPALSGGGVIDYGNIRAGSLSKTDYSLLPIKSLDFTIQCDAPTRVAVKAINGRPDTAAGSIHSGYGGVNVVPFFLFEKDQFVAGLGMDGTRRIGGYAMRFAEGSASADGKSVAGIFSTNEGSSWKSLSDSNAGGIFHGNAMRYLSWATAGTLTPLAFENLRAKLEVQAYLNKSSELDLSKTVKLDGLTTIELVYL